MSITHHDLETRLDQPLAAFRDAFSISKPEKKKRLLSQLDILLRSQQGLELVYERIPALVSAGLFEETPWADPRYLVPGLVAGTLLAGHSYSTMEVLSELRMLAIAEGHLEATVSQHEAVRYLEEVIVANFELVVEDFSAPVWKSYAEGELQKIWLLFDKLQSVVTLDQLEDIMMKKIAMQLAHRAIETRKAEGMIIALATHFEQQGTTLNPRLRDLKQILLPARTPAPEKLKEAQLRAQCHQLGRNMAQTGLVSKYHLKVLQYIAREKPDLVPEALALDAHGQAEFERHEAFICLLITAFLTPAKKQGVYGLTRVLQRTLFSRKPTWHAINRLLRIPIHSTVAANLQQGNLSGEEATPIQLLVSGILCVLGQPLGVRQGNNPTCQSARAISMWSRHAPAKLINLLIDAAMSNNVIFRYEGELIESSSVLAGVAEKIDYKLDAVSIVLVPLLDKVYNEMMKRAAVKHVLRDPHISVNPAFYGHWIQTGFQSVYDPATNRIRDYEQFVRTFYASFHPDYNGGHQLIYPVPLGIFITDTRGNMLGYHAISLLRMARAPGGEWRAYYFNPNSEGSQDWGQGIVTTVTNHGERHGESSLPVHQFVARVYAFHYNELRLGNKAKSVPAETVANIKHLALESWGRKYTW